MATKRILLLGANGQVGTALLEHPGPSDFKLWAMDRAACDIANHGQTQKTIAETRPDLVINAAAMTGVDACETEQDRAVAANFEGPANLAAQCCARDIPLIHLSTDFVFDGRDHQVPYAPESLMNPLNVYGNTKMMGEESVRHELAWHTIVRLSSVFSAHGANILTRGVDLALARPELAFVTDQVAAPTYAADVAQALWRMAERILAGQSGTFGTFHYAGEPAASRYDFMREVIDAVATTTGKNPPLRPALTTDFPAPAARPAWSVLDTQKTQRVFGVMPSDWKKGVRHAVGRVLGLRAGQT